MRFTPRSIEQFDAHSALSAPDIVATKDDMFRDVQGDDGRMVSRIAAMVVKSQPGLTPIQVQQAVFMRQMFNDGEICFIQFLSRMRNLFPERMDEIMHQMNASEYLN